MVVVLLLVTCWVLIQLPPVQTWLVSRVTHRLSRNLHTTIRIRHVDFSLFNRMILEGTLVQDLKKDTLLYAGQVKVSITDWFFFKDKAELKYIGLEDATIKLQRTDSVWNYQFLADYFSGSPKQKPDTAQSLSLDLKKLEFSHIHVLKRDMWRGEDMELRLTGLGLDAEKFSFSQKVGRIRTLTFNKPVFILTNYEGRRPPRTDTTEEVPKNDPLHLRLNPDGWDITARQILIRNGSFTHEKPEDFHPNKHFDGDHIFFHAINTNFSNFRLKKDTITAQLVLNTKERSGLEIRRLSAAIKWFPEAMEFRQLDLQTGKSRLKNFFAMRFKTLDDMSWFTTRIRLEADFTDADIDSDDIGWFAPELKDWKKKIRITGHIHGPVADLNGRNVIVEAGRNTYLNGDFHLKGLPSIPTTFIEFKSNEFRTTYADMAALIPSLKTITSPRIDRMEWLRFKGSFTGYFRDFVTNGTIETGLGTVVADVNMKLPASAPAIYAGKISTDSFDLGTFLDNTNLGEIAFQGKVSGKGLRSSTLNASLDGAIDHIDFNDYVYRNIRINGAIAQKKFNGDLLAADSNLNARLNGLIDFSLAQPKFNFEADVTHADLQQLHFAGQPLRFNGKFKCNFTGDDIDNFLGTANIYEASLYKNGQRVSFDSLSLESSIVDNNKTITVLSNEFDGAIVGEFSIKDLPASFQTFLHQYYPSYIKPAKTITGNQNFSFVITTKKVDEYIDLFSKDLKGFNNAGISGRINIRENLLDLNLDLPNFGYKKISFDHLTLKGKGNLDSLSMETHIGDIFVGDSLHFPNTYVQLHSSNDISRVLLTTSGSQPLNAANLSAEVQTLPTGVKVRFNPSTFDINSKTWNIDKDGELAFSKDLISAYGLKIHSGDQQLQITTHPSDEGNWNDIHVDLTKINIGDFAPFVTRTERLEGLLTGSANMTDPFGKLTASFNGTADQFRFANDSIGTLKLEAAYQRSTGVVNTAVHSDNQNYHFDVKGLINTADSSEGPPIDILTDVSDTKIDLLERYLGGIFTNLSGKVTGKLQITGPGNRLQYLGTVQLKDAGLKVAYTQCSYKIPSATIQFKKDTIDFGTLQLKDKFGHTADLTRGKLMHHSFNDLGFDFALNTNRMLLLDTKATDNNQFYGTVIGKATMTLRGPETNMVMNIKGEPTDSSNIYLPPSVNRETGDGGMFTWKVYGKEMKENTEESKISDLLVNLDIYANNYANVYVILDPLSGDIIKANGHGPLNMKVGTTEDFTISGRYEIDRGIYNFNFQSFIHKPFILSPGVGSFIQWNGDPYDARISIEAVYRAENVRFSDLGLSSASGVVISNDNVRKYRGDILVVADLTGKLTNPDIAFQIDLPPGSPFKNDQEALAIIQKIQSDKNELNKQVSTLVVLNSFVPLTNSATNFDVGSPITGVVVNSISGVISNAFSKQIYHLLNRIFNDKNIRFNFNTTLYSGTNLVESNQTGYLDRTNLNFSIAKSFMNEKLTFTVGSALDFGNTAQQATASSFQFLPDITAEYKITADGRVVLTFFYRDFYNYYSASASHTTNSSGASISYRRDFDRIDELFRKKKKNKHPKPLKPEAPKPEAPKENTSGN